MPLKDKDVRQLVRKLVSWARRLRDSALCQSCGVHQSLITAPSGRMRCSMFEKWKWSKLKYATNGFQNPRSNRDILYLMLLSCSLSRRVKMQDLPLPIPRRKLGHTETVRKILLTLACRILSARNVELLITLLCQMTADRNRYSHLAKNLLVQIVYILSRFRSQRRNLSPLAPCSLCSKSRHHTEDRRRSDRYLQQDTNRTTMRNTKSDSINEDNRLSLLPLQLKPDYLPILVGTISVPLMPCPIMISPGPVTVMLRRLLKLKEKLVGMALPASQFGTVLQVCDCIELVDGSFILSTLGRGRFQIIKRVIIQQSLVAKVKMVYDRPPSTASLPLNPYIEATGNRIVQLFNTFFDKLKPDVKDNILGCYGPLDKYLRMTEHSANGPAFLWWMTAVLPLSDELKVHLISCEYIHKRMVIIQDALIKANIIYEDIKPVDQATMN